MKTKSLDMVQFRPLTLAERDNLIHRFVAETKLIANHIKTAGDDLLSLDRVDAIDMLQLAQLKLDSLITDIRKTMPGSMIARPATHRRKRA